MADSPSKNKRQRDEVEEQQEEEEPQQEDEDDDDDESTDSPERILRYLQAVAQAQGIPFDFLLHQYARQGEEEEDSYEPLADLSALADFIQSDACRKVLLLVGAGMSVASGIPDFRSPNGLYNTIPIDALTATTDQKDNIRDDASFALDQHLFLENPTICLELQRDFLLGIRQHRWKPTLAHYFIKFLQEEGKLKRIYTQNIDGLEHQVVVEGNSDEDGTNPLILPVHGTMDRAECAVCKYPMDFDRFCDAVETNIKDLSDPDAANRSSTGIPCRRCGKPMVKPAIVLFRSSLPPEFFACMERDMNNDDDIDLLLILGTSLRVAPANTIVYRVPPQCHRVLFNRTKEGHHLGMDYDTRDLFLPGDIETTVLELMVRLGWTDRLEELDEEALPPNSAKLVREKLQSLQQNKESKTNAE